MDSECRLQRDVPTASPVRNSILSFIPLLLPALLFFATEQFGREGIYFGRVTYSLFLIVLGVLGCFYNVKAILDFFRRLPFRIVNLSVGIVCIGMLVYMHGKDPYLDAFESSLKKNYNATELRLWAIGILNQVKQNGVPPKGLLTKAQYPECVLRGKFPQPEFITVINDQGNEDAGHIKMGWGSGVVGTWGLLVGPTAMPKQGRQWISGVCFFVNPEPFGWKQ